MNTYDLQTDTHLSKDFNKILQSCMISCNNAKLTVESNPHFDYLKSYYATIDTFFSNTFFLFENLNYKGNAYPVVMMNKMKYIKQGMQAMKLNKEDRTSEKFDDILETCNLVHMMIMTGLQQRKMLVRMSESEPRGAQSIEHWEEKPTFKKGNLKIEKDEKYDFLVT